MFEVFKANIYEYKDRIIPIRATSIDGLKILKYLQVKPDMIYIDAGHEFDDVTRDIELALKLFPECKHIFGDDYNWIGVQQAVQFQLDNLLYNDKKVKLDVNNQNVCWHLEFV